MNVLLIIYAWVNALKLQPLLLLLLHEFVYHSSDVSHGWNFMYLAGCSYNPNIWKYNITPISDVNR